MTTYIDITGSNLKTGPWIYKVSTKAFKFKTVAGIREGYDYEKILYNNGLFCLFRYS